MKKIISTTFLLGMLLSASMLSAQKLTQEKMKAIYSDNVATFKKQFTQGDYNKCFILGDTSYSPLTFSAQAGKMNIVKFLVDNKVNVNKKCQNRTPLEVLESSKRTEIIQFLIERGAKRD